MFAMFQINGDLSNFGRHSEYLRLPNPTNEYDLVVIHRNSGDAPFDLMSYFIVGHGKQVSKSERPIISACDSYFSSDILWESNYELQLPIDKIWCRPYRGIFPCDGSFNSSSCNGKIQVKLLYKSSVPIGAITQEGLSQKQISPDNLYDNSFKLFRCTDRYKAIYSFQGEPTSTRFDWVSIKAYEKSTNILVGEASNIEVLKSPVSLETNSRLSKDRPESIVYFGEAMISIESLVPRKRFMVRFEVWLEDINGGTPSVKLFENEFLIEALPNNQ
jgi:hypothetical protein